MAFLASGESNLRPMSRFTAKTVFSGLVMAWRLAICPTSRSPDSVKPTIEGVVRLPSLLGMTTGSPPSITATQELVVPRSIPMTLPMVLTESPRVFPVSAGGASASATAGAAAAGARATTTSAGRTSRSLSMKPRRTSEATGRRDVLSLLLAHGLVHARVERLAPAVKP